MKTPENRLAGSSSSHEVGEQTPPQGFSIRVENPDLIFKAVQRSVSGELGQSLLEKPIEAIKVNLSSERGQFNLKARVRLNTISSSGNNNLRTGGFREDVAKQFGEYKERGNNFIITGSRGTTLVIARVIVLSECMVVTGLAGHMLITEGQLIPHPAESTKKNLDNALADLGDVIKAIVANIYGEAGKPIPDQELVLRPPKVEVNRRDKNRGFGEIFDKNETPYELLGKISIEKPDIRFEDVGGQEEAKREIQGLAFALKNPELYRKWGTKPPKGVILDGPPGTGKTLMAKALASQAGAGFFHVQASDIASKWYGESEQIVRQIFELAAGAKGNTIIFFDEIDAIAPKREEAHEATRRSISVLLENMDGMASHDNVMVVASTNRLDFVDPALLRAGRFDRWVEVPLPDEEGRKQIFNIHIKKAEALAGRKLFTDINIDQLVEKTNNFSGADIAEIIRRTLEEKVRLEGTAGFESDLVDTDNINSELNYYEKTKGRKKRLGE